MKILMIEDDKPTVEVIKTTLAVCDPGSMIQSTDKGRDGLASVKTEIFDVVVLDLGLPDIDGIKLLEELRAFSQTPVLIMSARHDPEVITYALNMGAQDYVLKPFNFRTFLSSLQEVSNRAGNKRNPDIPERISATITIRGNSPEVLFKGEPVELEADERKVLGILLDNCGTLVMARKLASLLSENGVVFSSTIQDIIDRLRKKLGDDPYLPQIIVSEYECGYRLLRSTSFSNTT